MNALKQHALLFKALGDPKRLLILALLADCNGTITVAELLNQLALAGNEIEQPTLSYHLKELRMVGLVDYSKCGLHHYYTICEGIGRELAEIIERYTGSRIAV